MLRKTLLSLLSGFIILIVTWIYQNYNFTFSAEDSFIGKLSYWKYKVFSSDPQKTADFVFINTGKDLALVDDTAESGNIAVSDREKIYHFLRFIDSIQQKPRLTVLDLQFYYQYNINPSIDILMQQELDKNNKLLIAILPDESSKDGYRKPLYKSKYGYSEYGTYGSGVNKFRIINQRSIHSIPVIIHETVDSAVYEDHNMYATCNGRLCMSAIWPSYYLNDKNLKNNKYLPHSQYYTLGDVLIGMQASPAEYAKIFDGKIVMVGNFELDTHSTPIGTMPGTVIVADIYLSLLNNHHIVSTLFLILLWMALSALSYLAWFSKVPEVKLRLNFIFSPHVVHFIKSYISYFGSMFFLSVIALFVFNIQIALFLPSFIFSLIEYFMQKKYLPEK
ncbi:MAG TPA: CHASE2 domain-containing protein [Puia sp.]|nr:CHASE2 domain-containing protein [Puia sp.]